MTISKEELNKLIEDCPENIVGAVRFLIEVLDGNKGGVSETVDIRPLIDFMGYFLEADYKITRKIIFILPGDVKITIHKAHGTHRDNPKIVIKDIKSATMPFRTRFSKTQGFDFEQFLRMIFDELERRKGV